VDLPYYIQHHRQAAIHTAVTVSQLTTIPAEDKQAKWITITDSWVCITLHKCLMQYCKQCTILHGLLCGFCLAIIAACLCSVSSCKATHNDIHNSSFNTTSILMRHRDRALASNRAPGAISGQRWDSKTPRWAWGKKRHGMQYFCPLVPWHCCLGDRKDAGLLVVMIWLELCTSHCSRCHHHLHQF